MTTILDEIVQSKRQEIANARERMPMRELEQQLENAPSVRDFRGALEKRTERMAVIAEVKKASPSAGIIRADFDPVQLAGAYQEYGADCISVLTDEPYFQGHLDYLREIRQAVDVPLLRKDFLIDEYQVVEARVAGADAVLLIAEILDDNALSLLVEKAFALGMQTLVELYDAENLTRVLSCGTQLLGINNRNLRTFETKLEHTIDLATRVPEDVLLVSESGIRTAADVQRLWDAGARAVLIGETLMRADHVGEKLQELVGTPKG